MNLIKLENGKWMCRMGNLEKSGFEISAADGLKIQFDSKIDALTAMVKTAERELMFLRRELYDAMD